MEVRAAVVEAPGEPPRLSRVTLADPIDDEVLVRIEAVGVCHTDLTWADGGFGWHGPSVPGHELAGVVEEVGPSVRHTRVGDRVLVSVTNHCGRCSYCERGAPPLCVRRDERRERLTRAGAPILQGFGTGGFAEATVVREAAIVVLPDATDLSVAAVIGCAVATGFGAAFTIARIRPGSTVLVVGCGAVGAASLMAARVAGAASVVAVDPHPERRAAALTFGADQAVTPDGSEPLRGAFDYVIEAAGTVAAATLALSAARPLGTVVLAGLPAAGTSVPLDLQSIVIGQKQVVGCNMGNLRPHVDVPEYLELHASGRVDLARLVTRRFDLEDIADAFAHARAGVGIRSVVVPNRLRAELA